MLTHRVDTLIQTFAERWKRTQTRKE